MKGKVKWYDDIKGFGFIQTEEKDIFVHRTGLKDTFKGLEPEQEVEFEVREGAKGPVAQDVIVVE